MVAQCKDGVDATGRDQDWVTVLAAMSRSQDIGMGASPSVEKYLQCRSRDEGLIRKREEKRIAGANRRTGAGFNR